MIYNREVTYTVSMSAEELGVVIDTLAWAADHVVHIPKGERADMLATLVAQFRVLRDCGGM